MGLKGEKERKRMERGRSIEIKRIKDMTIERKKERSRDWGTFVGW